MIEVGRDIISLTLLFTLVFGMSATVDTKSVKKQLTNKTALSTGIFLQFAVLPCIGFVVVKIFKLSKSTGIILLVVTSSPGGSYSNWWCSMFNADLALSVSMTAISTFMSIFMLPINLIMYSRSSYSGDVVRSLDWVSLFSSLVIVMSAISAGILWSARNQSATRSLMCNKLGNIAGIGLVIFSIIVSNSKDVQDGSLWGREWKFYLGVASPCILGLIFSNVISWYFNLPKTERVTVSIECCYQNVGIATSVALTMFKGEELAEAIGVPLFYGLVEAILVGVYCITAWKLGWTKAPRGASIWSVLGKSYEVETTLSQACVDVTDELKDDDVRERQSSDVLISNEESGYTEPSTSITTDSASNRTCFSPMEASRVVD